MPRKQADPIAMLKEDHEKVKKLFDRFESTSGRRTKQNAARDAIMELDVHADLEEGIFYPAMREAAEGREDMQLMLEAEEEHHVVHLLIAELKSMSDEDERFDAKFTVLAENVRHHIEEEESEMLPKAQELDAELLAELGQRMAERKRAARDEYKAQMEGAGSAASASGSGSRSGSSSGGSRSRSGGTRSS